MLDFSLYLPSSVSSEVAEMFLNGFEDTRYLLILEMRKILGEASDDRSFAVPYEQLQELIYELKRLDDTIERWRDKIEEREQQGESHTNERE